MKILIDFFPILLFFGAYKFADIYLATAVLMAATVLQTALIYTIDRKLQAMQKITLALILVFILLPEPPKKEHAPVEKIRGLDLSQLWQAITGPLGILSQKI